jgi:hypothetical protein
MLFFLARGLYRPPRDGSIFLKTKPAETVADREFDPVDAAMPDDSHRGRSVGDTSTFG